MRRILKNSIIVIGVLLLLTVSIWGPEYLASYRDLSSLNQIITEPMEGAEEGYRYTLSSNEKLYILAQCLNNQVLPEAEQNRKNRVNSNEVAYDELTGSYAFVINRQGPTDKEIEETEIYDICNREIEVLKELGILPDKVRTISAAAYSAELYSAIDILDPRNNLSVWKVELSTSQQNADKSNRILDVYIDANTGKLYEFYVRMEAGWEDIAPKEIVESWSDYLELQGMQEYEIDNPLLETTPYFQKYRFPGMEEGSTIVTIGFYEGINELFLKIS